MSKKWARNASDEAWLEAQGVEFEYVENVRISQIDLKKSKELNPRLDCRVNEDVVVQYGEAMEQGAIFPAPFLVHEPGGGYLVIAGNHRIPAAGLVGRKTLDAFVILSTDRPVWEFLARTDNRRGAALPQSKEEAVIHAIAVMTLQNKNVGEVARDFLLPAHWLSSQLRAHHASEVLTSAGIPHVDKLKPTFLVELAKLREDEKIMKRAAALVIRRKLTGSAVTALVKAIRALKDSDAAVAYIQKLDAELKIKQTVVTPVPPRPRRAIAARKQFMLHSTALYNLLTTKGPRNGPLTNATQLELSVEERVGLRTQWRQIRKQMALVLTE